ncbi:MAG: FHA domain-containing protein [Prevotellaceae bacterium]|jgi:hypothetical protein|nr:FHA domain-containing protein [Prevotellaceae bacterium]
MEFFICPHCKAEIDNDSFYCDQCGKPLLLCPDCRTPGKGKRCTRCGKELQAAQSLAAAAPAAAPAVKEGTVGKEIHPERTIRPQTPPGKLPTKLVSADPPLKLGLEDGVVIGRRSGGFAEVLVSQSYLSGKHARLQKNGAGTWEVVDLGSTNGTFLNGEALTPQHPAAFQVGDVIRFANLEFSVQ